MTVISRYDCRLYSVELRKFRGFRFGLFAFHFKFHAHRKFCVNSIVSVTNTLSKYLIIFDNFSEKIYISINIQFIEVAFPNQLLKDVQVLNKFCSISSLFLQLLFLTINDGHNHRPQ